MTRPIFPSAQESLRREGNAEGALFGESLVFTGALGIPRREAADMAARAGCDVAANVSRKTTLLVVGTQDRSKLKGYQKSTKHRKAETLIEQRFGNPDSVGERLFGTYRSELVRAIRLSVVRRRTGDVAD